MTANVNPETGEVIEHWAPESLDDAMARRTGCPVRIKDVYMRKDEISLSLDDVEQIARIKSWRNGAQSDAYRRRAIQTARIDALRKLYAERGAMSALEQTLRPSTDGGIGEVELRVAVEQALNSMPSGWARAIEVRMVAPGYTDREYAAALGVSLNAYKSALARGRRRLRAILG